MAKKRKPKAVAGWPMGYAPPGAPTRMILEGPRGRIELPLTVLTRLSEEREAEGTINEAGYPGVPVEEELEWEDNP